MEGAKSVVNFPEGEHMSVPVGSTAVFIRQASRLLAMCSLVLIRPARHGPCTIDAKSPFFFSPGISFSSALHMQTRDNCFEFDGVESCSPPSPSMRVGRSAWESLPTWVQGAGLGFDKRNNRIRDSGWESLQSLWTWRRQAKVTGTYSDRVHTKYGVRQHPTRQ